MKNIFTIGVVIAIAFTVGSVMTAGGSQVNPNVSRGPVPAISPCYMGFNQGSYAGAVAPNYECKTAIIACPQKSGWTAAIEAQPVSNSPQGIRFAYRCVYQHPVD